MKTRSFWGMIFCQSLLPMVVTGVVSLLQLVGLTILLFSSSVYSAIAFDLFNDYNPAILVIIDPVIRLEKHSHAILLKKHVFDHLLLPSQTQTGEANSPCPLN